MKRYIRSSSSVKPEVYEANGLTVVIQGDPFQYGIRLRGEVDEDTSLYSIEDKEQFIQDATDAVLRATSYDERISLKLRLAINFGHMYSGSFDFVRALLNSMVVAPKTYSNGGRGWSDDCPALNSRGSSNLSISTSALHAFESNVREYTDYLLEMLTKLQQFETNSQDISEDALKGFHDFRHWIVDEKLGNMPISEGRNWLISRTVENRRSQWSDAHHYEKGLKEINALFDYIEDNNLTYADIKKLSKQASDYYRRKF